MKYQIRQGIFETNSSSTHSITICTKQEFEDWKKGKLVFDRYEDKLVINDKPIINKNDKDEDYEEDEDYEDDVDDEDNEDFITYEEFMHMQQETFEEEFKTPSGDEMVAFGYYGYDY